MTCVNMTTPSTIPTQITTQNDTKANTSAHKITAKTSGITGSLVKLSLWNLQISLVHVDERVHLICLGAASRAYASDKHSGYDYW